MDDDVEGSGDDLEPELEWLAQVDDSGGPRVCASRARSEYRIPERVLSKLECDLARNPRYKNAAPMRLYNREEVLEAAVSHHRAKRQAEEDEAGRPKKPKYAPQPRAVPDMAAVYDQHRLGDAPGSMLFPDDILAVLVEQMFTAYRSEQHSAGSAITHTARDLARLAQGSKALHTTVMAAWQHLARLVDQELELAAKASASVAAQLRQPPYSLPADYNSNHSLLCSRLPAVADLDWDEVVANIGALRVVDMKDALKALGLKVSGVKAELSERLRDRFGLTKSAPVPAQLLACVAGWMKSQRGWQPQSRRRGRQGRETRYRLRWNDGSPSYSIDSRMGDSEDDSDGDGYCSGYDYGESYHASMRRISNPRQPAGGPAAPQHPPPQHRPHPPQNHQPQGGCAGCTKQTPAQACPHRMCGSCCKGCSRHVK